MRRGRLVVVVVIVGQRHQGQELSLVKVSKNARRFVVVIVGVMDPCNVHGCLLWEQNGIHDCGGSRKGPSRVPKFS